MEIQITIIVPVFNEAEVLPQLQKSLDQYLRFTPQSSRILFVDDGSTDGSLEIINSICQIDSRFSYTSLATHQGLSTAIKSGIDLAETPYIGYMDADLQTTPMDFMLLFQHLNCSNMVNGVRVYQNDEVLKRISHWTANWFRRMVIKDGIKDTCCPLKIIETDYAKNIPFFKGMERFIPALVQMLGGTVKQAEVSHFRTAAGKAKYHLFNHVFGPLVDTMAVLWMKRNWIQRLRHENVSQDIE